MTREEQIIKEFTDRYPRIDQNSARFYFKVGAEWADANRWVKVEDGLPEFANVLVCYKHGVMECKFIGGKFQIVTFNGSSFVPDVTHWMPLPEPPKAEQ